MVLPVILGLVGAALLGGGFVLQQREASGVDGDDGLSLRLIGTLMRRRPWWLGIGLMAAGYVLAGWSLGSGNLVLVEPLLAANLLFALPIAAVLGRRRPRRRSVLGALALAAGVAGFVVSGYPNGGRSVRIPAATWCWSAGIVAGVVCALVFLAWHRHASTRAVLLGAATGTVYGMQDALTRRVYGGMSHGFVSLLTDWPVWTLFAVGALGVLLAQNAFDCAPLTSSLPAISVCEPVTGIALGIGVFDAHVRTSAWALAVEALSLLVMLAGALVVARARVVHAIASAAQEGERRAA